MSLNMNQFAMTPVQGQIDLPVGPVIAAEIDASSAGSLVPGTCVKIVDSAGGIPKVVEIAADTDAVFGVIAYDRQHPTFSDYDKCQLGVMRNTVMYMTASAAIARGASVMPVVASTKVATATSNKRIIGYALDKAAADGDLIRVVLDLPGALAP